MRRRKRKGFISFSEAVAPKPISEAKKWMSSIRQRPLNPDRVPRPSLSVDKLDVYADNFACVFSL